MKSIGLAIFAACILLVACGGSGDSTGVAAVAPTLVAPAGAGQVSLGGAALGGNAQTTVLAQLGFNEVPGGPLAWVTHRLKLGAGER